MVTIALDFAEPAMHRTVFYERFIETLRASPGFLTDPAAASLIFPAEDTAIETNWPRYGRPETAFVRGNLDLGVYQAYLSRLLQTTRPLCIVNMHPFIRVPVLLQGNERIAVADVNLRTWERTLNPRAISMPALPIMTATNRGPARSVLASFRGVASHPVRQALAAIGDGRQIITQLVDKTNHVGRIDAEQPKAAGDAAYLELLETSLFAFVPRGDAEFSYRLLEVLSAGCIPIVLSDGLVLPFDRIIDWSAIALHVPENKVPEIPAILKSFTNARVAAMQAAIVRTYAERFASLEAVVASLLEEARLALRLG